MPSSIKRFAAASWACSTSFPATPFEAPGTCTPQTAWRATLHAPRSRRPTCRRWSPVALVFCLPFAHSERLEDQDLPLELNTRLGPEARRHAEGHRDIVKRFGRFPHRNPMPGRENTPGESEFLRAGGFEG